MRNNKLLIAGALAVVSLSPAKAASDFSAFGAPVETNAPAKPTARASSAVNMRWPAYVCAEIQRMEKQVITGARPTDRGMTRIGLLLLQQLHCGIDISAKIQADQAVLEEAQRKSQRDYEENMEAALRAASRPREPIILQVPQAAPTSSTPDPSPTLNCFTNRFGNGMSTTTCR